MKHPKVKKPRRRHRLNIKKFAVIVLVLGCAATLIALAAKANQETAISKTDIKAGEDIEASQSAPDATKNAKQGAPDKTQKTDLTNPLKGRMIVVDAGHGGFDPGAIGINGTYESEINLAIAKYLETEFKSCGAKVIMTRNDDSGLGTTQDESLEERRQIIEQTVRILSSAYI